ncbi:OLC1v1012587C1 [Oldenlandia corymbosa var. corymbosa]|uniref:OLC1v1012587C1 n=1 Tax=Oldenlandia corymbosa var. corymbosa TaxID=529605 RepID=A0AAV1DWB5_OLDCO|nr:OLC1v1012587C1 [Oldenlandia corymbosa var. corymbosa]
MERGTAQVNITEVIDQFSGPIGKIKQVEIFMYIVSAMVSFLVVFGSLRRSSTNAFLRYSIVGAFVFSFTLIINIIGQINSPNYNIFYPIWAIFVVLLYGNPYSISAYSLEDNEQWKRTYFEVLLQMFWLGWVVGKNMYLFKYVGFNVTSYIMICACSWKITERMEALKFASKEGLITGTKSVVDFMSDEHELGPALQGDPKHTRGYHYLVTCEKKSNFGINGFSTRKKEEADFLYLNSLSRNKGNWSVKGFSKMLKTTKDHFA